MQFLFSTFGSLGDLHPTLALALVAKARGHQPVIATSKFYQAKIEALGIGFAPVRPDMPSAEEMATVGARVMDKEGGPRFLFEEMLGPSLFQSYADLMEASNGADAIVTNPAAPAGPLVARKKALPWLSCALAPISLWSALDPPVPPTKPQLDALRVLGPLWGWPLKIAGRMFTAGWMPQVAQLCRDEKIAFAGNPVFEGQFSPHGTLALFSPQLARPQRDWPAHTAVTGFCFYDESGYGNSPDDLDKLNSWLNEGPPPLVFTLGSAALHRAGSFWQQSKAMADALGVRALLLTGQEASVVQPSPQLLCLRYAPYSHVFGRALAVVHQGGIGTTAQALRAGVPQLVVPFAQDQPDNAARVARLGVGRTLSLEQYNSQGYGVLQALLSDNNGHLAKAKAIGALVQKEEGPQKAIETLEGLCNDAPGRFKSR